jgi:hypothetical protein
MKQRFTFSLLAALLMTAGMAVNVFAQDATDTLPAHPRFARLHTNVNRDLQNPPAAPLPTWNGSFVYSGETFNYTMVGKAPTTGKKTTVHAYIIPLAMVYSSGGTTTTFSPEQTLSNGQTVIENTVASPIFQTQDYTTPEGTDLGVTQYEDAFQRGNFWGEIPKTKASNYHVLLSQPTVKKLVTINVPSEQGSIGSAFGVTVGLADINWFDSVIDPIITKLKLPVNSLPIFVTYDVYLTDGGECCIGGYHNFDGTYAYSQFTYIGTPGVFAQDVSALSHEVGEWMDDPLTDNAVACGVLEVGDPEEGYADYGAFPYTLNGFTYHLQDLVYLEYFGAPTTTSVDGGALTFHDNPFHLTICSQGG